jgi:hypothetical protein
MMKKILLVSLLCFAPIFATHAADLTEQNCIDWGNYSDEESPEEVSYTALPQLIQDVLNKENRLRKWISTNNQNLLVEKTVIELRTEEALNECAAISQVEDKTLKERTLSKITLSLKKALAEYDTLETRARMPFVHDGNVLPGPSTEEDGSFYVEQKFIPKFVNGTLIFLMSLSILMIIIGGLMFLFSSGDSDLTARAKTTIMWSIVGVIITILAYAIVQFIIGIDFTLG